MKKELFTTKAMLILLAIAYYPGPSNACLNPCALGTSGRIELSLSAFSSNNNFIPLENKNEKIESIQTKNDDQKTLPVMTPAFELNYTFSRDLKIYIGTPFSVEYSRGNENREGLTMGVWHSFEDNSALDVSAFIGGGSVWEDPYAENMDRNDTYFTNIGAKALYKNIMGTGLLTSYKIQFIHVDEDEIGTIEHDLKRNGLIHTLKVGYMLSFLKHHFITPGFYYSQGVFDGKSNDFERYQTEITYTCELPKNKIGCRFNYDHMAFDHIHPIFDTSNEMENRSAAIFFTREDLFQKEGFYSTLQCDYLNTQSNIDFYDSESLKLWVSFGIYF